MLGAASAVLAFPFVVTDVDPRLCSAMFRYGLVVLVISGLVWACLEALD
jgi:hypothetical protein